MAGPAHSAALDEPVPGQLRQDAAAGHDPCNRQPAGWGQRHKTRQVTQRREWQGHAGKSDADGGRAQCRAGAPSRRQCLLPNPASCMIVSVPLRAAEFVRFAGECSGVGSVAARLGNYLQGTIRANIAIAKRPKVVFFVTLNPGFTGLWPAIPADAGAYCRRWRVAWQIAECDATLHRWTAGLGKTRGAGIEQLTHMQGMSGSRTYSCRLHPGPSR